MRHPPNLPNRGALYSDTQTARVPRRQPESAHRVAHDAWGGSTSGYHTPRRRCPKNQHCILF